MAKKKIKREEKPRGGVLDWLTDRAIRGLIGLALALPWRLRVPLMGRLMSRVVAPLAGWQARAEANLAHVWPDMPEAERRRTARAVADNAGRTTIENYDIKGLLARMGETELQGEGLAEMEEARAAGRPILFVTGHYGNHEAPRAALVARGWRIGGLYRPMANPYFNAHYAANMHAMSDPVFEQGRRGTMGLIKHIKEGGMGVLLFDVYDSSGVVFDFMGKPAPTLTSVADIALRANALLVPFFGVRRADGLGFDAIFERPVPHGEPLAMMKDVSARLEARIAEDPGQWFWIHRRWKPKRQEKRQRKRAAANIGP